MSIANAQQQSERRHFAPNVFILAVNGILSLAKAAPVGSRRASGCLPFFPRLPSREAGQHVCSRHGRTGKHEGTARKVSGDGWRGRKKERKREKKREGGRGGLNGASGGWRRQRVGIYSSHSLPTQTLQLDGNG